MKLAEKNFRNRNLQQQKFIKEKFTVVKIYSKKLHSKNQKQSFYNANICIIKTFGKRNWKGGGVG
jgi:hypothetical protein